MWLVNYLRNVRYKHVKDMVLLSVINLRANTLIMGTLTSWAKHGSSL